MMMIKISIPYYFNNYFVTMGEKITSSIPVVNDKISKYCLSSKPSISISYVSFICRRNTRTDRFFNQKKKKQFANLM